MKTRLFRAALHTLAGLSMAFLLGTCPTMAGLGYDARPAAPERAAARPYPAPRTVTLSAAAAPRPAPQLPTALPALLPAPRPGAQSIPRPSAELPLLVIPGASPLPAELLPAALPLPVPRPSPMPLPSEPQAKEEREQAPVFFAVKAQQYVLPDAGDLAILADAVKPMPGFRAELGCELGGFRLSVESGYSYIEGTNPLVRELEFVPLFAKAGYEFSPTEQLGIMPYIEGGLLFSTVQHYETAFDMLTEHAVSSEGRSLMLSAGLELEWRFHETVAATLGVEAGLVIEEATPIPMLSVQAGVRLQPFSRAVGGT
ncbi:MAG: hypothetical protein LBR16_03205 [Treponema sp.]|jgi:hypothetical protein|nr:hypothetical protein [Treponema sp.]